MTTPRSARERASRTRRGGPSAIVLEACVDSTESAVTAARAGAGRVELCANLVEGGTTPSAGAIQRAVGDVAAEVMVMIRPRGGDFCYSRREVDIMMRDIDHAGAAGAAGAVLGCLTPDGDVDRRVTKRLVDVARRAGAAGPDGRPLAVTFHRAFDMSRDAGEALEVLVDLGVDRVLTSGRQPSALEGAALIAELVAAADDRIVILAGVGIDASNVLPLIEATGVREIHVYTEASRPSPMRFRNDRLAMGRPYEPDEYSLIETDGDAIAAIAERLRKGR